MLRYADLGRRVEVPRVVGALVLLFVFFLPLHFHTVDDSGQISHECSCIHGTGTQLAAPAQSVVLTVVPTVLFAVATRTQAFVSLAVASDPARAPPISL
jgi:hypothetical protein